MIYEREEDDPECVTSFTIILKGTWKLSIDDKQEEFIYKRIGIPENEELLTQLFCEVPEDKLPTPDFSKRPLFLATSYQHILERFFMSQG